MAEIEIKQLQTECTVLLQSFKIIYITQLLLIDEGCLLDSVNPWK